MRVFGLLDDVAVLARLAAATGRATAKAAGVVIDDTAVTPHTSTDRCRARVAIIKRIAIGSLRDKLLLICPPRCSASSRRRCAPILMLGAIYLCYEARQGAGHYPRS